MNPIRFRLLKIYLILRNALRFNHWRGHGIHSPFMYGLVRNVLVKRRVENPGVEMPAELLNYHLLKRDTVFITNLYKYLGYGRCVLSGEPLPEGPAFVVAPHRSDPGRLEQTVDRIGKSDMRCIAVLGVNKSPETYRLCREWVRTQECVSVDLYRTWLFFFDPKLKKQHYRIRSRYGDPLINSLPYRYGKPKNEPL